MPRRKNIDFDLINRYPNKHNLIPQNILELKVIDWERLKKETEYENGIESVKLWAYIAWCNHPDKVGEEPLNEECDFFIDFMEETGKVLSCCFSSNNGRHCYEFEEFYNTEDIRNEYDLNVQVNAIKWLNRMIDEGILGIPNE